MKTISLSMTCLLVALSFGCESSNDSQTDAATPPFVYPTDCDPVTNPRIGQHGYELANPGSQIARYLLYIPSGYASRASWPLILFLHGSGESGTNLETVKRHGTPKYLDQWTDFPFVVLSPQNLDASWWSRTEIDALLNDIVCRYNIDPQRIYLTGISLGGYAAWSLGAAWPTRFAALAPVSGSGDPAEACAVAHVPVWAFHGGRDPWVPLEGEQAMIDAHVDCGGSGVLTVFPDAYHDVWDETYGPNTLYDWFLNSTTARTAAPAVLRLR